MVVEDRRVLELVRAQDVEVQVNRFMPDSEPRKVAVVGRVTYDVDVASIGLASKRAADPDDLNGDLDPSEISK